MTPTLSRYIARNYFINMIFLLLILLGIIYLFDTVELIRRTSKKEDISFGLVLQMGLLKLPEVGQLLFPFAILFSAMFTFWQLTKRYELIVVRSAGFSVWQFLAPVIGVAVFVGILQMLIINPVGAVLIGKFTELENKYLRHNTSQIAFFEEGLWLRQGLENPDHYAILHAPRIEKTTWKLRDVTMLQFDGQDNFIMRTDARRALLKDGFWEFHNVQIHRAGATVPENLSELVLPTQLTVTEIEDSFASPDTMSFWNLPGYIQTLEATGFDATRLRVYYQNLWAQPLFFASMILLAASVSLRPPRQRGTFMLIVLGVFIGFLVFFLSSYLQALGTSHQIPAALAAWAPSLICFLLGLTVIMNLEDG
ncbi:MAG: LPS export ABC transporter permease LptG [Micavibrio sp.]|nr:LPS export ABC transporter permease LptG [Micavibrio sp.]